MIKGECERKEKEYSLVQRSGKGYLHACKPRQEKKRILTSSVPHCSVVVNPL